MAKKRTNVIRKVFLQDFVENFWQPAPAIVEDARLPNRYRILLPIVDVIFADVAQPDQARIVVHNAESFLKDGGHVIISIKASCIDSTMPPETIFASQVQFLKEHSFKPLEQVTLEPYERDHAMVTGLSSFYPSPWFHTETFFFSSDILPIWRSYLVFISGLESEDDTSVFHVHTYVAQRFILYFFVFYVYDA